MKTKLRKLIFSMLMICTSVVAFTACNSDDVTTPKHTHTFGEWTTSKLATCTAAGARSHTCTECGESVAETIPARGHTEVTDEATALSCTSDRLTEGKHCSVCNVVLVEQDRVTAAGHQLIDGTCSVCGKGATKGLTYIKLVNQTYMVTGMSPGETEKDIIIPDMHDGAKVTVIGKEAFVKDYRNQPPVEAVTLGSNITQIEASAFQGQDTLGYIKLSDSLKDIGEYAFSDCFSLKNPVFPKTLFNIGRNAFSNCNLALTNISIPDSVKNIGESAFSGCSKLKNVVIGNGVTEISTDTFGGCPALKSVSIGSKVSVIGEAAFSYTGSIESIIIGKSVRTVKAAAFIWATSSYNSDDQEDRPAIRNVWFAGTADEWQKIEMEYLIDYFPENGAPDTNVELRSANVQFYSETQPSGSGNYWHYMDGIPTKW